MNKPYVNIPAPKIFFIVLQPSITLRPAGRAALKQLFEPKQIEECRPSQHVKMFDRQGSMDCQTGCCKKLRPTTNAICMMAYRPGTLRRLSGRWCGDYLDREKILVQSIRFSSFESLAACGIAEPAFGKDCIGQSSF